MREAPRGCRLRRSAARVRSLAQQQPKQQASATMSAPKVARTGTSIVASSPPPTSRRGVGSEQTGAGDEVLDPVVEVAVTVAEVVEVTVEEDDVDSSKSSACPP